MFSNTSSAPDGGVIVASNGQGFETLSVDGDGNIFTGIAEGPPRLLVNITKDLDVDGSGYEEPTHNSFFGYLGMLPCHGFDTKRTAYPGNNEGYGADCCPWAITSGSRMIMECPPVKPTAPK